MKKKRQLHNQSMHLQKLIVSIEMKKSHSIGYHNTITARNNKGNLQLDGKKFNLYVVEFVKKLEGTGNKYWTYGSVI